MVRITTTASGLAVECSLGVAHQPLRMSATTILWGQLLFVSIVVLAFLWAATEWTAWRLAFQPQLGPAWFVIGRWPIYQPLAFFIWWFKFDAYAPDDLHAGRRASPQAAGSLPSLLPSSSRSGGRRKPST